MCLTRAVRPNIGGVTVFLGPASWWTPAGTTIAKVSAPWPTRSGRAGPGQCGMSSRPDSHGAGPQACAVGKARIGGPHQSSAHFRRDGPHGQALWVLDSWSPPGHQAFTARTRTPVAAVRATSEQRSTTVGGQEALRRARPARAHRPRPARAHPLRPARAHPPRVATAPYAACALHGCANRVRCSI
jgi:hypothetical protein